jgi:hypothetical protein
VGNSELTGGLVARLLGHPGYWDAVADKGRTTVEERFGPERFAQQYRQLYREVISQSGSCTHGYGGLLWRIRHRRPVARLQ